jgi:uncharacterized protein YdaU (DUF1376 family)
MSSPWYPFYPGDYGRDTAHLSLCENGAFRSLLDHCYATGGQLPKGKAALYRICRASDDAERSAVDSVVSQFFVFRDDGYHNGRADRELAKQAELKDRLSGSGRRGAQKRWGINGQTNDYPNGKAISQANGLSMANPQPQPQPLPHPDKETTKAPENGAGVTLPDWLPAEPWNSFLDMRKKLRKPLTVAAVKLAVKRLGDLRTAGDDPKAVLEQSVLNGYQGLFELRAPFTTRGEQERAQRNADATVGRYNPDVKPPEITAEERAELESTKINIELWKELEKGVLEMTAGNVAWAKEKLERLRKVPRLPAQDSRPAQLSSFLKKAREAHPEAN